MIRNVIFDMGGVLVGYRPELSSCAYTQSPEDAAFIRRELFEREEWRQLDAGAIEEDAALSLVLERLPERLHPACRDVFSHWHEFLPPIEGMLELIHELKAHGVKTYVCSNAAMRFFVFRDTIEAMSLMDGILVSAEERCVKPNRAIYERLFQKFGLNPEECFFIDDIPANIEGGRAFGMEGHVFDGNVPELRRQLVKNGIL